ncbi:MAG: PQQ-like beta-propeller repeat protein [Prevotellaceae bacterium]|nr:PQQ-like beta-propeller repeat protein [Candidatus Minthosoma caballi]
MNNKIYRNITMITGIFMLALSAMLIVNYFQVSAASPLENEVLETLKELNESNSDNAQLQEQIRQLDLLTRKAYFIQESHLKWGMYILGSMALVVIVCLRMYYKTSKNLPSKDLDIVDEWLGKSSSRNYITWGGIGLVAVALGFGLLSTPALKNKVEELVEEGGLIANNDSIQEDALVPDTALLAEAETDSIASTEEAADSLPIPKLTYNAFRGNNSSATSAVRGIPTSWDLASGKNIAWKVSVPRQGYNSPVINGRNIFLTAADAQARELFCYDVHTGKLNWSVKADKIPGSPSAMPKVTPDTGLAASTVATNGKQVCAIFATGDILCTDMEGKRLWAKNLGVPDNHYGYGSSLLINGNALYVQYINNGKSQIMALNVTNGNQMWSKSTKDKISWSSPIIANVGGKSALIVTTNPAVTAYNPANGTELWRVDCLTGEVGASPTANGGTIYAASEYSKCVAIDGATGEVKWEASDYLPECSSPAASKNLLYVATSYGVVCAYNTETGAVVKEHDVSSPFYSSPVIADGKVWLFSNDGKAYIFSSGNDFGIVNSFQTGEKTFATPAFTDGMMIVRSDKSLYCVKKM